MASPGPPPGYGPPTSYQRPPPRQPTIHSYATASMWVGIAGVLAILPTLFFVGWSPITGVSAILLGYVASKKIAASPWNDAFVDSGRYTGLWRARTGIILGAIGCAVYVFWLGRTTGHSAWDRPTIATVAAIVGGLATTAGVIAIATKWRWGVLRGIAGASLPVLFLVGSASGMIGARSDAAEKVALCQQNENDAQTQLAAKDFSAAYVAITLARHGCPSTEDAKVVELNREINRQEQLAKQAAADEAAAAKETEAVQTFPQKSAEIAAWCKRATNDANAGKWDDADNDLNGAEHDLNGFIGTSIVPTKPFQDLRAQVQALRQKWQPQIDRVAERERKRREAEDAKAEKERQASAAVDAVRGPMPERSEYTGELLCVNLYLAHALNDPDSYQHVGTTTPVAAGPYWVVVSRFRAKNAFGALTLHQATFKIQHDEVVSMVEQ